MSSVSSFKITLVSLLLLLFTGKPQVILAGENKAPVFRRTESGDLVRTGERRAVPDDLAGNRKTFLYKVPPPGKFEQGFLSSPGSAGMVDGELNVVMIRIAFQDNSRSGLSSIKTGGDFDLSPYDSSIVDPTPHNRTYFNAHMQGLANYMRFQSCGKLEVNWEILPLEENGSYKLSDVADYGPGSYTVGWTNDQLADFLYDAVVLADQELSGAGYPRRLSDYDAIILVHAGADIQSDYRGDSPNDIPSFFAILGDGDEIPIEGGTTIIREISVVPETATQDGSYGSMASVLGHEFGHVLGLPDLYDVYYGSPIVGVWDQMDSGPLLGAYVEDRGEIVYVTGMLPSGLGAWSRYALGWAETDTINTFDNQIDLPAVEKCPSRLVRVEISNDEYFLIENRAVEIDGILTGFVADPLTGVVIGTGNCMNCGGGIPDEIEWELTNGYDILLPTESDIPETDAGPGILIWHVDESFIEDRWYSNEVNSRWPYGVWVVEGSGVTDLGNPYSGFRMGWFDDAFFEGNRSEFSDSTIPSSWSNWGVPTGVRIEGITRRDTVMTFGAGNRDIRAADRFFFPSDIADGGLLPLSGGFRNLVIDLYGNGLIAGEDEKVFSLGRPAVTPVVYSSLFDHMAHSDAVIVADYGGQVHAFRTGGGQWTEYGGWPFDAGSALVTHPVEVRRTDETLIAVIDSDGGLRLLASDGSVASALSSPSGTRFKGNISIEADQQGYASGIFALVTVDGAQTARILHWVFTGERDLQSDALWQYDISLSAGEAAGETALLSGDIDPERDGSEVYLSMLQSGRILYCTGSGVISERKTGASLTAVPALQDINGDGFIDICCSDGSKIFVISSSGANVSGWPRDINAVFDLPAPVKISSPLTTAQNGSGRWIAAGTSKGLFFLFDYRGKLVPGYPKKMASSFKDAVDIVKSGDEALFSYSDIIRNIGYNPYFEFRPGIGKIRWRSAPFDPGGLDDSWTSLWGGPGRTAFAANTGGFSETDDEWKAIDDNLVIYPNPSTGERVGFHFNAPLTGEAFLKIMTLAGELVYEEKKDLSGGEDEFEVSLSGKASGIYLCRLVIVSSGRKYQANRKFAIVN